ncbi:MAG: hypothetical protein ACREDR_16445 [Blastocatellia bacterium]
MADEDPNAQSPFRYSNSNTFALGGLVVQARSLNAVTKRIGTLPQHEAHQSFAIEFLNKNETYEDDILYKTINGGRTWTKTLLKRQFSGWNVDNKRRMFATAKDGLFSITP